jgi:hypothetical protein
MPILCTELSQPTLDMLCERIEALPEAHPFRQEVVAGVKIFTDGDVVVFESRLGLYYRRMGGEELGSKRLESALQEEINNVRNCLSTAFEVDTDDPSVIRQLRDRFQENHGVRMARTIDDHVLEYRGKRIMIVKLPAPVVRHMLAPTGGLLHTTVSGASESLRALPTVEQYGQLEDAPRDANGRIKTVIVTKYAEGQHAVAQHLHYNIMREAITRPNLGVCIGPFCAWDS